MLDKNITYAAIRIGSVIILVGLFERFPTVFYYTYLSVNTTTNFDIVAATITSFTYLAAAIVAFLMWSFPVTIARLFGLWPSNSEVAHFRYSWLESSLLAVLGLYFVANALVDLAYYSGLETSIYNRSDGTQEVTPQTIGGIAAAGLQLIIGLALSTGARHIPYFLRRLRRL